MKGILTAHVKTQFNCGKNIIKAYKNKEATNKNFKNIKTYVKNKEGNKKRHDRQHSFLHSWCCTLSRRKL